MLLIPADRQGEFSGLRSLADLGRLRAGFGAQWGDLAVLKENGLAVEEVADAAQLIPMLAGRRMDYVPRGLNEAWTELEANRGRTIRVAGFITDAGHLTTKTGSKFGKMTLNDYSGNFEIALWKNDYVKFGNFLVNNQKVMIQGVYDENKFRQGVMEFQVQNMMLLEEVRKLLTKRLVFSIPTAKLDAEFVRFMEKAIKNSPGNTELIIQVADDANDRSIRLKTQGQRIYLTDDLIAYFHDHDYIQYSVEKS